MDSHRTSARTLGLLRCYHVFFPLAVAINMLLTFLCLRGLVAFNPRVDTWIMWNSNCYWLLVPFFFANWKRLLFAPSHMVPFRLEERQNKIRVRSYSHLYICFVTKGTNMMAFKRSLRRAKQIKGLDKRISIHVLTEEFQTAYFENIPNIEVNGVPTDFSPLKAKNKPRCLEWFRISKNLTKTDWVLHLDEETVVDEESIRACLDVIERSNAHIGQGVILYNAHNYWQNWLLTASDLVRVVDDLGIYRVLMERDDPFLGLHGSFLLINGTAANQITWDTDWSHEDYWFSLQARRGRFKFAWIPAIAREQSPETIHDWFQQRRRWYTAGWQLSQIQGGSGGWRLNSIMAKIGLLADVWFLLDYPVRALWAFDLYFTPVPLWFFITFFVGIMIGVTERIVACIVQDLDAGVRSWRMAAHVVFTIIAIPVVDIMSGLAQIFTILRPAKGFYVIKK